MKSLRTTAPLLAAVTAAVLSTVSCAGAAGEGPTTPEAGTGSGALDPGTGTAGGREAALTIGAASYPGSRVIGAIYAAALEAQGITVRERLHTSAREAYLTALKDGSVDIVPERTGALALYFDQNAKVEDPTAVYQRLKRLIPARLAVLRPSAAEVQDSVTVTKGTARRLHLKTIGDLRGRARGLVLGAAPAFEQQRQGVPGLQKEYGVVFGDVRPLARQTLPTALESGRIDAAGLFTTDPSIGMDDFVVLKDPKGLFGAQNVVPLMVKDKISPTVRQALNGVSAKLDTTTLLKLNKEVQVDHQDVETVARQFLKANGLDRSR